MYISMRIPALIKMVAVTALIGACFALLLQAYPTFGDVGQAPQPDDPDRAGPAQFGYRVSGTGDAGLNLRECPDLRCPVISHLGEGIELVVDCWQSGVDISGNRRWLHGTVSGQAGFAAEHFLVPEHQVDVPECR